MSWSGAGTSFCAVDTLEDLRDALRRGVGADGLRREVGELLIAMLESPAAKTRREVQHLLAAVNLFAGGFLPLVLGRMRAAQLSNLRGTMHLDADERTEVPDVASLVQKVRRLSGRSAIDGSD